MKKIFFLLFISTFAFGQKTAVFLPDSSEFIVFPAYQDSLLRALEKNQAFVQQLADRYGTFYDNRFQYKRFSEITIDNLEMELFDQRLAQQKMIESGLTDSFLKKYLLSELNNQYWHLIFAYPIIRGNADQKVRRLISLPNIITRDFNPKLLSTDDILKSKAGRNLLYYWVTYENSRENNFEKYSNLLIGVNDKVEYTLKHLNGLVADYTIAQVLQAHQGFLTNSLAQNIISQINSHVVRDRFTGPFLDQVFAVNQQKEAAQKAEDAKKSKGYGFEFTDLKGKTFSFEKYKGKVIYLDFWATWCGPCRAQFPFSKKLHEQIPAKLKKDIVFLYISIDDTVEQWKEGVESIGLEEYENGFTEGAWGSPVLQKLGIRSIPRYMIIGKDGKIVDDNAKRPSNAEILSDLIKYAE